MTIICAWCGREIPRSQTFCNKACYDEWQRRFPNQGAFKNQRGANKVGIAIAKLKVGELDDNNRV